MRRADLVIWLLCTAAISGCDENPVGPTPVRDVTWKLEVIERAGGGTIAVSDPERYTLRLESDGRLNVRADCNTCNGRYALGGTSLSLIAPMACTRAFCGAASLDTTYIAALEGAQSVVTSNSQLIVQGNGVTLRFRH